MKIPTTLLTAAFALVAIASVALPTAQPADAATGPDLKPKIDDIQTGSIGQPSVWARIINVGTAKSGSAIVHKMCGYEPPEQNEGILLHWVTVDPFPATIVSDLRADGGSESVHFNCPLRNGRKAIAVGIALTPSAGETNTANNVLRQFVYRLEP